VANASTDRSLHALFAAITDSVATAPDEEILADAVANGEDPNEIAADVRTVIARSTKRFKQRKLMGARAGLAASREAYLSRSPRIPSDRAAQRALYFQVAQQHPQFTMQQRDLAALPAEELLEILKQMEALGLLPDNEE